MLLSLEIIESQLAKSSSDSVESNTLPEIKMTKELVEEARQKLNNAITKIGEVKNAYTTLSEGKSRVKITKVSFLLTAIYCFSFIVLIGIEAHYQWNILKIERMIYFYSIFTLFCIGFSFVFPNNEMSNVNGISIVSFPILYLGVAILILMSYECIDYMKFRNHQLNACMNVGTILIMPLVPFVLHIWATPYILDKQKSRLDLEYKDIISQLPVPIKKRIKISEPPVWCVKKPQKLKSSCGFLFSSANKTCKD